MTTLKNLTIVSAFVLGLFLNGISATTSYELAGSVYADQVPSSDEAYVSNGDIYVCSPFATNVYIVIADSYDIIGNDIEVTLDGKIYIIPLSDNHEFIEFVENL